MSRREYKTIKRRLNAGRISSVKEGKYCGNQPPYGYERIKLEHEKGFSLRPIPEQAEVVKLIYAWYVGTDGERIGMAKIARRLNDMHILTQKGRDWTIPSISSILQNPVYAGKLRWQARKAVRKIENGSVVISRPQSKDYLLVDGRHEPLIPWDLYQKAADLKSTNPPRPISTHNTVKKSACRDHIL